MSNNNPNEQKIKREFGLTTWAVNNRTTVFFLTVIILFAGMMSYMGMPKEAFPEVTLPTIYVGTPYPGNSPEDIENLITRPLEKEINTISNIKKISSNSVQDMSTIIVEFESDQDPETALREVKDAVDKKKKDLPSDLDTDPIVDDINMGEFPIMFINLSGDYSKEQLKEYAEVLEEMIEDLDEISEVNIRGIDEKEVKIDLDLHKMMALELSFNDVSNAIRGRNVTISAGNIKKDGFEQSIKVNAEIEEVEELNNVIVKHEKGNIVYLKDILADTIRFEAKDMESYATFNKEDVVKLDVVKGSGKNLIEASNKINKILEEVKSSDYTGDLPQDLKYTITIDQSDQTRAQVNNLENSIISGVILVVLVLLFFLGTRNSLFVGLAIPMSMFLSFLILSSLGVTINMMVLFGLIMALGMLVDNGIVVVENIYRLMDEGYTPVQAAREGVGEVAWPIISSTATTLAAFMPLALWPGIMGEFMKYLPMTLIIVLSSSLFVALVINPAFTTVFMEVGEDKSKSKSGPIKFGLGMIVLGLLCVVGLTPVIGGVMQLIGVLEFLAVILMLFWTNNKFSKTLLLFDKPIQDFITSFGLIIIGGMIGGSQGIGWGNLLIFSGLLTFVNVYLLIPGAKKFQNNFLPRLENAYERTLKVALKGYRPRWILVGTFFLMIFSYILIGIFTPKVEFFPDNEPKYVNIFIEMPLGTDIYKTTDFTLDLEKDVYDVVGEDIGIIKAISSQVGKGTSDPGDPFGGGDVATPHKARINIEFVKYEERGDKGSPEVMRKVQEFIQSQDYPGVVISVEKDRAGPPTGKPISIEITGKDYDVLINNADKMMNEIGHSGIRGIEELKSDLERGKPELVLDVDYAKAGRLGVSAQDIAMALRTSVFGSEVSKYKKGEDEYDIMVRLAKKYRNNVNSLLNQTITFRSQADGKIKQIPINAVAKARYKPAFASIKRRDLERQVTLSSNVIDGFNANEIVQQLKVLLEDYQMPEGYSFKFAGEQEEQAKEMGFLLTALGIAVFLILLIIVAQFNKISAPIIILSSVLLSTTGVFLGLVITQQPFVIIMTMMGIISLAGIVVNNAIVLIDYTDLTKERALADLEDETKYTKENLIDNIVQAGKTRLRPVLLTAITTVLGLVPLAIGLNIDFFGFFERYQADLSIGGENTIFWGPMSWAIIYGITFATFLTLVVVPVMYLLVARFKTKVYKRNHA